MNSYKKLLWLVIGLVLASLILTACGTSSSGDSNFPTGKFVSASDQDQVYVFNEDKTWQYLFYGQVGAEGTYSVKGNLWTNNGDEECPFPGTYEWSFDGTNLTFKLVGEDECRPRREATDGQTFVLTK